MNQLHERSVFCPYCGESIDVFIDPSESRQDYVEDCQVCCRPINFQVAVELDGRISLYASSDSD